MAPRKIYRIVDANFNRSREGLRVCEEISRFVLNNAPLTAKLKSLRHDLTSVLKNLPVPYEKLVSARNSQTDVGRRTQVSDRTRVDFKDIFLANMERVKESLRVLEEATKLMDAPSSERIKKIRFRAYTLEKSFLTRRRAL